MILILQYFSTFFYFNQFAEFIAILNEFKKLKLSKKILKLTFFWEMILSLIKNLIKIWSQKIIKEYIILLSKSNLP